MYATILAGVIVLTTIIHGSVPRILGVVPEQPVSGLKAQSITVNGEDFRGGLTLIVTAPGGDVKNVSGPDISGVGATTFKAMVTLDRPGAYRLVVVNTDGGKSDPFPLTAIAAKPAPKPPVIDRVQPAEVARSQEVQVITIRGSGFEPGLKVSITDPTGTVASKDVFDRVEAQVIVFRTTFEMAGSYALQVTNASGAASNTVSITVR
jgi:hypothetical protein